MFSEGFTLQLPPPKTRSTGRYTDAPSWPITPRMWSPYPRKANYGTVRRSSTTVRHGWIAQAARKTQYQHSDNQLLQFLRRRSRDLSKLRLRDRAGNPERRPCLCLVSHPCSSQKRVWSPCQAAASASKPGRREAAQRYADV